MIASASHMLRAFAARAMLLRARYFFTPILSPRLPPLPDCCRHFFDVLRFFTPPSPLMPPSYSRRFAAAIFRHAFVSRLPFERFLSPFRRHYAIAR